MKPIMCPEHVRNFRVEHTVWTACAVLCSAMLALYLIECLPYLSFRYEIDPSDGDVVNQSVRILRGFPLYRDWSKGEIIGNYAPGYFYYLALASSVGFDPVVAGRWFVQRSFIADIPAISKVMNACFHVVAKSETPDRGTLRAMEILEYTGPSGSCSLAAELTP